MLNGWYSALALFFWGGGGGPTDFQSHVTALKKWHNYAAKQAI
jgi:hypothetical protein